MAKPLPRYQKLEVTLRDQIETGRWRAGERLPSIRSLCQDYHLSKITVQHALQRLEALGLIEARERSGFFVVPPQNKFEVPGQAPTPD